MATEQFIELNDNVPLWSLSRRPMGPWTTQEIEAKTDHLEDLPNELLRVANEARVEWPVQAIEIHKVEGPRDNEKQITCTATVRYAQEEIKGETK